MRRSPLHEEHLRLGGKMVDFAGWELPVMYSSIIEEHEATRSAAGLFDISHMGEILIRGGNSRAMLASLIPTRLDRLAPGAAMYSCLCNERGGVIDDIFIFMLAEKEYYLVVNASTTEKDLAWLRGHAMAGVEIRDLSDATAKIDIQGPNSGTILRKIIDDKRVDEIGRFHFFHAAYGGSQIMVSQTGYTGEYGFELFLDAGKAPQLWRDLLASGGDLGLKPAGLGARDSLRLEASYSLYGHELNDELTPVESGLSWLVSSGEDFIGRSAIMAQKESGAPRRMICYELTGRGIPREHCIIFKDGARIGITTSGGYSPTFRKGIGMALVDSGSAREGDEIAVEIRGTQVPAVVVKRPFYAYKA